MQVSMPAKGAMEVEVIRKATWRLLPFLMLAYFIAFVDRVNSGFAALQMNHDVGLTQAAFGLGAGIFYISYVLCEVPSNLALEKVGARLWIARIMVTWGLVSMLMALVVGPYSFYAVRFLLGAAEAGFFPGVILYLTYWFPAEYRGRIVAMFMVAIPVSSLIGSPISALLLQTDGWMGLHGWQWMFILEAIPAVVMGVACLFVLPNGPAQARWLTSEQRTWLTEKLAQEKALARTAPHMPLLAILTNKYVLTLALVYAGSSGVSQALSLWQPQMLKSFGLTNMQVGLLNGIPFAVASVAMIWWGRRSDRVRERVWHTALPLGLSALALASASFATTVAPFIVILCLILVGTYALKGPFFALSSEWLAGTAAAAGLAQINALGNLAGFVDSFLIGSIQGATGSYALALLPLVLIAAVGCVAVLLLGSGQPVRTNATTPSLH
jgi:ACS family tartrate transporter-like MFS transporter